VKERCEFGGRESEQSNSASRPPLLAPRRDCRFVRIDHGWIPTDTRRMEALVARLERRKCSINTERLSHLVWWANTRNRMPRLPVMPGHDGVAATCPRRDSEHDLEALEPELATRVR
jgi:hypothetical protein